MEYYSATKKNEILPVAATQIDLENIIMLNEMSQDRKRQTQYNTSYMWNLKKIQMYIYKTETDPQTQKTNLWLPNG